MPINSIAIEGNLTRDPELKYLPSGTAVCNVAIAQNQRWKDKDGATQEKALFFDCKAFGPKAETISKYLTKGRRIFVTGNLDHETWEKDGEKRSRVTIVIHEFSFGDSKRDSDTGDKPQEPSTNKDNLPF